ncbi:MAG: hypothetical protein ACD_26C00023G0001 [uncultured bacterium]|nr:MAG: hypothetical protein ACD_26C00023G0001 [uncultured bacterium]
MISTHPVALDRVNMIKILNTKNIDTIGDVLQRGNTIFAKIMRKNRDNKTLSLIFKSILDPELVKNCKFAGIENSTANIVVNNAAWATKVRYSLPEILKNLQTQPEFKDITNIRYSINKYNATTALKKKNVNVCKMSKENEILWRKTIERIKSASG